MSFDEVMSIYDLRHLITANIDNIYSLLYVNRNQLSFVKEYMSSSPLENPDEFILLEYILKLNRFHYIIDDTIESIIESVLTNTFSNMFRKLILMGFKYDIPNTFTIASYTNNYDIMKYILDNDKRATCCLNHIIYNKQYEILQYIVDNPKISGRFHEISLLIILLDDVKAFNIIITYDDSDIDYYMNKATALNKTEILKVINLLE